MLDKRKQKLGFAGMQKDIGEKIALSVFAVPRMTTSSRPESSFVPWYEGVFQVTSYASVLPALDSSSYREGIIV